MYSSPSVSVSVLGQSLSVSQRSAVLSNLQKFSCNASASAANSTSSFAFWGRINGIAGDYLIISETRLSDRIEKSYYWSLDSGLNFSQLPALDEFINEKAGKCVDGLLSGNPSKIIKERVVRKRKTLDEIEQQNGEEQEEEEEAAEESEDEAEADEEPADEDEGDEQVEKPVKPRKLFELERLSYIVSSIDSDTSIIARGSIIQSALGDYSRLLFSGLSGEQLNSLDNYLLLRSPKYELTHSLIRSNGIKNNSQCFDSLTLASEENGVFPIWSLILDQTGLNARIRSLKWLGYEYSIEAFNGNGVGAYFGTGQKNNDLLFMV